MKTLSQLYLETHRVSILESITFNNWVMPSEDDLRREFEVEQVKKGQRFWDDYESFRVRCKEAKIIPISKSVDSQIEYRSGTRDKEALIRLISTYKSYPKYRNETTVEAIYDGFKNNSKMTLPIVIKRKNGSMRIFSGNTRLDAAYHLGLTPKVLLVNSDN